MFILFISINAYSLYPYPYTYSTCYGGTYSTCGGYYGTCCYYETCSTCGSYDLSCQSNLPYTITLKTCLNTGCTKEVCMTDLFQNSLTYFYEYPYGYYPLYLLKPIIVETEEKIETMETCEMCMPDMFIWGGREKTNMMSILMSIPLEIFIQSEPAAPPAF